MIVWVHKAIINLDHCFSSSYPTLSKFSNYFLKYSITSRTCGFEGEQSKIKIKNTWGGKKSIGHQQEKQFSEEQVKTNPSHADG